MLYRKGPGMEAKLCFIGHGLMENRSGLIVDAARWCPAAERLAALEMIELARIVRARSRSAPTRAMTRPISSSAPR